MQLKQHEIPKNIPMTENNRRKTKHKITIHRLQPNNSKHNTGSETRLLSQEGLNEDFKSRKELKDRCNKINNNIQD